jgi:hypothetical protein
MIIYEHHDDQGNYGVVQTLGSDDIVYFTASNGEHGATFRLTTADVDDVIENLRPYGSQPTPPEPMPEWERELIEAAELVAEPEPVEPFLPEWDKDVYPLDHDQSARIEALKAARAVIGETGLMKRGAVDPFHAVTVARYIETGREFPATDAGAGE